MLTLIGGGDLDSRLSTSGYAILLNGGPIIWSSKTQSAVARSTAEAEFVAASLCSDNVLWIRRLLSELNRPQLEPTSIYIDNQAALAMINSPNPVHSKVKHIDISYMAIRNRIATKQITCSYINTKDNPADILTKSIAREQFEYLRNKLGLEEPSKAAE